MNRVTVIGQLMTGEWVLIGASTNSAHLGGSFMNLNFMLARSIHSWAFYVVMDNVFFWPIPEPYSAMTNPYVSGQRLKSALSQ